MSLKELVEGDCGGSSSLIQVTSHFVQDRGLKDEGLHHPYMHQEDTFVNSNPDQLLHQFWEQSLSTKQQQSFRMDSLLAEMRDLENASLRPKPQQSAPISLLAQQEDASEWANQFIESGSHFENSPSENIWNDAPVMKGTDLPGFDDNLLGFGPQWMTEYLGNANNISDDNREEERLDLINRSEDYQSAEERESLAEELKQSAKETVESLEQNGDMKQSKFMKYMSGLAESEAPGLEDTQEDITSKLWASEFQENTAQKWEADFLNRNRNEASTAAGTPSVTSEGDIWSKLNSNWKNMMNNMSSDMEHEWFSQFQRTKQFKDYTFHQDNPMLNEIDAFEQGKEKLRLGDLPSAILYLESAAQQSPENPAVWLTLGKSLSENEQDPQAISAFGKCLELEPKNLEALMDLSICYTNESFHQEALSTLKDWIINNEKYDTSSYNIEIPNLYEAPSMEIHKQVLGLYLNAARENPIDDIDPDVQNGLGVLFNLSDEYDKAVDCFKVALQVRPNDSRLWNRLGATLANGSRPEEAVDAYHNALQLSPGLIRARCNLGIACVHLGANKEAVEHFLTALNQQANARGILGESANSEDMSNPIWSSLRIVISSFSNRNDLLPYVTNKDLDSLNKEFGIL